MSDKVKTRDEVKEAWPYCKAGAVFHGREVWCVEKPGHAGGHRAETLDWVDVYWPEGEAEAERDDFGDPHR